MAAMRREQPPTAAKHNSWTIYSSPVIRRHSNRRCNQWTGKARAHVEVGGIVMKLKNFVVSSLVLAVSTFSAHAQTSNFSFGVTTVHLSEGFVSALGSLHVTPSPLGTSGLRDGAIDFPIIEGEFDPANLKAEIIHSGGLRLAAGGTTVDLRHFIIDTTGAKPVITGFVVLDGNVVGRLTLFDLQIKASDVGWESKSVLVLKNVGVTLDSGAAATLNSVFHITALKGGLDIGVADLIGALTN
jgi:hypothetical protein